MDHNNRHMENTTPAGNQLITCGTTPQCLSVQTRWIFNTDCSSLSARLFHFQASPIKPEKCDCPAQVGSCNFKLAKNLKSEPCSFAGFSMPRRLSAWCPAPQQKVQGISQLVSPTSPCFAQRAHTQLGSETARRPRQKRWIRISVGTKGSWIHKLASREYEVTELAERMKAT